MEREMIAPTGSNTLTGASTPPMFAQPAQQAQAQPVPQATPMPQQSYSTPGPGGNTGALNPVGILGQIIGKTPECETVKDDNEDFFGV